MEIIEFLPILAGSPVYFVISRIWTNAHFLVCLLSCHCLSIFNSLFSYLLSLILYFQLSVFSTFCIFNFCIFNFRIFNLLPVPFSTLISSEMSFPVSHDPFPVHFILNLWKWKLWKWKYDKWKWMCESECAKVNVWKWMCESEFVKVWKCEWKCESECLKVFQSPTIPFLLISFRICECENCESESMKSESVKVWRWMCESLKVWVKVWKVKVNVWKFSSLPRSPSCSFHF